MFKSTQNLLDDFHFGKYSCPQLPVQVYIQSDTDVHLKSASLAPAARGRSKEAEEKGEEDRRNIHPGTSRRRRHKGLLSEVIFFPWLSFLAISHSAPPSL